MGIIENALHCQRTNGVRKLSLIAFSGDFDRLTAAFTLATGAAAVCYEVNIFFTFWGLDAIKWKQGRSLTGKGFLSRAFGFMMGDWEQRQPAVSISWGLDRRYSVT